MSSKQSTSDIDVGSIWKGVSRSLPRLMLLTVLVGGLTYGALALVAPRYEAETQLTITAKATNPYSGSKSDPGAAAIVTPRLDPAAINTHVRALMAPDLLIEVGRTLNLGQRPEFNSAIGPVDKLDSILRMAGIGGPRSGETVESRVLANMNKNLSVSAARESRFITVRFTSTDPQVAASVANEIAESYRRSLREIPVRETNDAVAALLPKIKQLTREVFEAEAIAKRFRAESDQLTGGSTTLTLQQQRLAQLNSELVRIEAELAKSEARLAAAEELAKGGVADTLPEVQQSRIIQDLISQRVRVERQVNEARAVLLPAHPRMRQLNADLAGLQRSVRREVQTIVNSIAKEVRLNQLRTAQLRSEVTALKRVAVAKSGDEAKLRSLEASALSKRNELERLQRQLEDNRTVVDTNRVPVESTIVSVARPDDNAVFPKKASLSLLMMAATFMIGIALVVARELLRSGAPVGHNRRASDKAKAASRGTIKVAASAPQNVDARRDADKEGVADYVPNSAARRDGLSAPDAGGQRGREPSTKSASTTLADFARRFRALAPAGGGCRVLIAGEHDGIDPSDEAIDLAAELSDAGERVLLIDWTLGGKPLLCDIDVGDASGLDELLIGRAQFDDVLVALPDTNVHYVYASRNPDADLLDPEGLNLILDALDEAYDHVVMFGRHGDAVALFETIEGRFDAGMTVADAPFASADTRSDSFLGFDVTDIEIVHYARSASSAGSGGSRQTPAQSVVRQKA